MRLWIAPRLRSRRAVANGGPHLSVAYDLTCFIWLFELYKLCLKSTSMRLWIAPLVRSRRAVSNGGPLLSVAYDLTCFITFFVFQFWSKKFVFGKAWKCLYEAADGSIKQISSSFAQRWSSFVCSFNVALCWSVGWLVGCLGRQPPTLPPLLSSLLPRSPTFPP